MESKDITKIGINVVTLTKNEEISGWKTHVKEHKENWLKHFDTHGGLCQSEEGECMCMWYHHYCIFTYEDKVKSSSLPYNRCETRDKRPLGRDLKRSWCHRHTSMLLPIAMGCDQNSFIILIVWQWHQLLSRSLPNGHLSQISCRLGWELFTLPLYIYTLLVDKDLYKCGIVSICVFHPETSWFL